MNLRRPRLVASLIVLSGLVVGVLLTHQRGQPSLGEPAPAAFALGRRHSEPDAEATEPPAEDLARSVAIALYSYDTAGSREVWRRSLLETAGAGAGALSVLDFDRLIPDPGQWEQMAAVGQRAGITLRSAYVPSLWTQTVAEHPELPTGAAGITVTGTQTVTWTGGTSRVPVAVTLLLLCPPATERCTVNRVPEQVAR